MAITGAPSLLSRAVGAITGSVMGVAVCSRVAAGYRWQATWWRGASWMSGGSMMSQVPGMATGQRGWNGHPVGAAMTLGGSPLTTGADAAAGCAGSGSGTAAMSACE